MENSFFLTRAKQRKRALKHWRVHPVSVVRCVRDSEAWQGWRMLPAARPEEFLRRPFRNGERFILDFGEEVVGRLSLRLRSSENFNDSPVRLKLIFAETPVEIGERNRRYQGTLSRAWIQEEIVTLDDMPQLYKLPRVYAMRYLYLEVIATPGRLCIEELFFTAQSAATCCRRWSSSTPMRFCSTAPPSAPSATACRRSCWTGRNATGGYGSATCGSKRRSTR